MLYTCVIMAFHEIYKYSFTAKKPAFMDNKNEIYS